MNWGNKLIMVFACFGLLMGYLVYRCTLAPVNLVSIEYYNDELAYQQVIDGKNSAAKLSRPVLLFIEDQQLLVQLPPEMKSRVIKGEIWFYCASNPENDKKIRLDVEDKGEQVIPVSFLLPANYQVKISWQANNISYYHQQSLTIKK